MITHVDFTAMSNSINIWTDGASRGNPGTGAWGFYIVSPDGKAEDCYQSYKNVTNNQMELTAVLEALKYVVSSGLTADEINIYSDSNYVVSTFSHWIYGWLKTGTITQKKNYQLILDIKLLLDVLRRDEWIVRFIKVKGHSNDIGNTRADANCNLAMDSNTSKIVLFSSNISKDYYFGIARELDKGNQFIRIFIHQ